MGYIRPRDRENEEKGDIIRVRVMAKKHDWGDPYDSPADERTLDGEKFRLHFERFNRKKDAEGRAEQIRNGWLMGLKRKARVVKWRGFYWIYGTRGQ